MIRRGGCFEGAGVAGHAGSAPRDIAVLPAHRRIIRVAPRPVGFSVRIATIAVVAQAEVRVVARRPRVLVWRLAHPLLARHPTNKLCLPHGCQLAAIVPAVSGEASHIFLCANENAFRERLSVWCGTKPCETASADHRLGSPARLGWSPTR